MTAKLPRDDCRRDWIWDRQVETARDAETFAFAAVAQGPVATPLPRELAARGAQAAGGGLRAEGQLLASAEPRRPDAVRPSPLDYSHTADSPHRLLEALAADRRHKDLFGHHLFREEFPGLPDEGPNVLRLQRRVMRFFGRPDHVDPNDVGVVGGIDDPMDAVLVVLEQVCRAKENTDQLRPLSGLGCVPGVDAVFQVVSSLQGVVHP